MKVDQKAPSQTTLQCVSAIIPTSGDRLSMLRRAIDSVMLSSQCVKEVIVISDHMPGDISRAQISDMLAKIVCPFSIKLLFTRGCESASIARNTGVAAAEGDYLCFLDDDDELLENGIEARLELMRKYDVDFVIGDFYRVSQSGRKRYVSSRLGSISEYIISGYCQTPTIMVNARVRDKVQFPIVPKFQDYTYILKLLLANFSGRHLAQPVYVQNLHSGQRMSQIDNKLEAWCQRISIEKLALDRVTREVVPDVKFRWKMELIKAGVYYKKIGKLIWLCPDLRRLKTRRNIVLYMKAWIAVVLPRALLSRFQHQLADWL